MYARDVPKIKQFVKDTGPQGLLSVGAFVLSTIQTPLSRTKEMVSDIREKGLNSPHLWGSKRGGYHHLWVYRKELHEMLVRSPVSPEDAVFRLLAVPGLGLPKASFLLQCIGYPVACLDSHNLRRFGVPTTVTKVGRVKPQTIRQKIQQYQQACDQHGDSEFWWDSWCEYVSGNRYNKSLGDADKVSAYHYEAITA